MTQTRESSGILLRCITTRLMLAASTLMLAVGMAYADDHWAKGTLTLTVNGSFATRDTYEPLSTWDWLNGNDNGGMEQGDAQYSASLASASVTAHAAAAIDPAHLSWGQVIAQVNVVSFQDRLTFSIPAGDYSSGLQASIDGFVHGDMQADAIGGTGHAGGAGSMRMVVVPQWGGTVYYYTGMVGVDSIEVGKPRALGIGDFFTLTFDLLPINTALAAPTTVSAYFIGEALLNGSATGTAALPDGTEATRTSFTADFTAAFTQLNVPAGVGWVSDSGVFLSQPIPEPTTWAMLLAGIGLLGWRLHASKRTGRGQSER